MKLMRQTIAPLLCLSQQHNHPLYGRRFFNLKIYGATKNHAILCCSIRMLEAAREELKDPRGFDVHHLTMYSPDLNV